MSNRTMESSLPSSRRMTCTSTTLRASLLYSFLFLYVMMCCNLCQSYSLVAPSSPLTNHRIRSLARSDPRIPTTTPPSTVAASRRPYTQPKPKSTTELQIAATSVSTTAALISTLSGGLFSGGLHAIAGPDHLAALLPRCIGQRWHRSIRVGAIWGIGHGISATLLGCVAFFIKRASTNYLFASSSGRSSRLLLWLASRGSSMMDIAVGVSLIVIGIMGIKEAREWEFEPILEANDAPQHKSLSSAVNMAEVLSNQSEVQQLHSSEHSSFGTSSSTKVVPIRTRAILFNGILHGFSWDGAPSLAPALALITWGHTISFLSAYALGTTVTMALVTTVIGEGTRRASQIFHRPDLPQKFSLASSLLAIGIGAIWCGLGLR